MQGWLTNLEISENNTDMKFDLTGIDLFSGAGGLTLAARKIGIDVKVAVENNKHACSTYRRNFIINQPKPIQLIEKDLNELDLNHLLDSGHFSRGDCDVLMGGPPCQGFSTHRIKDAGVKDPRNELLLKYFDCIHAVNPKTFLVENVTGLLWERHKNYLNLFLNLSKESGYTIFGPTLLNARCFGVPQNRKRIFIVGMRNDLQLDLPWPPKITHFSPDSDEVIKDGMPTWLHASTVFEIPLAVNDPNAIHMKHSAELTEVFKSTPPNGGSRSSSIRILPCHKEHNGHKDVYGRIDPYKAGPTMTTACVNPSKGRFLHPIENHGISLRHAARFQTFPDSFIFEGGLMAGAMQVGNAVPVLLGEAVLKAISDTLKTVR
jgi:DNA (cytosine-5)-methyltransferase 1